MTRAQTGVTEQLAEHALAIRVEDLPPEVLDRTKQLFLDFLANALGGAAFADSSGAFSSAVGRLSLGVHGPCSVVGSESLYPPAYAALLNAAFAHSMDFDDTHRESVIHIGSPVFSTCLALAEPAGASGTSLLSAAVAGYEVIGRIGNVHGEGIHHRGFHPTATTGIFGATAAGARILEMDKGVLLNALGLNLSQAAGTMRFLETGSWNKRLQVGLTAHNAIYAVTFAGSGFIGDGDPIDGRYGYLDLYSQDACDVSRALDDLGERFEVMNTAVKPYPSCRYNHGALDGVLSIVREHRLAPGDIASIDVTLNRVGMDLVGYPEDIKRRPESVVDGQFSVYFAVASAARDGAFSWSSYENLHDPTVQSLMQRVSARLDTTIPYLGAAVSISTRDGAVIHRDVPLARGEPESFPTWGETESKLRGTAGTLLPEERIRAVVDVVRGLESVEDVTQLTGLLRTGGQW